MITSRQISNPTATTPAFAEGAPRLFSFDEYLQMAQHGILKPGERTELIEGQIYNMLPVGHPHHRCVLKFVRLLHDHLPGDQWAIISQVTVEFDDHVAPEPDICIAQGTPELFDDRYPTAEECAYVIEVSDTSLAYDRGKKLKLYAGLGVSTYWIVNLIDRTLEQYTAVDTANAKYNWKRIFTEQDEIVMSFAGEADLIFKLSAVLPKSN